MNQLSFCMKNPTFYDTEEFLDEVQMMLGRYKYFGFVNYIS